MLTGKPAKCWEISLEELYGLQIDPIVSPEW